MKSKDTERQTTKKRRRTTRQRTRLPIPADIQRKLLLECGFKCSIPNCPIAQGLDFHHINRDPGDNREENLLVLCAVHHRLAHTRGSRLDRKACEQLKRTITRLSIPLVLDKRALRRAWDELQTETDRSAKRGELFELVVENLLASVMGLIVSEKRARRPTGEVDILLRNETEDMFLSKHGAYIVVECSARPGEPVRAPEVTAFLGKMALNGWTTGFLFSLSGFTPEAVAASRSAAGRGFLIALFGPEDVTYMIEADDRAQSIKDAMARSFRAG